MFGSLAFRDLVSPPDAPASGKAARDFRLDFFRGLALFFIFVGHIPNNVVSWLTIRNFGLSDATEIFIFISGYSAMLAYGATLRRQGFPFAAAQVLRRCWQIYVAHIFLTVVFIAYIAYVSLKYRNPMFVEEMRIVIFVAEPHVTLWQALLLKFKPGNLDVLPLYVALLLVFPLVLWGMNRNAPLVLAASFLLWLAANIFNWNLPGHPRGTTWFFNPFAWQFLFVFGAFAAHVRHIGLWERLNPRVFVPLAIVVLALSLLLVVSWSHPKLHAWLVPQALAKIMYPIDKTNLDILRILHFLALAYLVVRFVKADAGFLTWRAAWPAIVCGQHSLHIFCLGAFLSFAGHLVLVEFNGSIAMQIAVSAAGIAIMVGLAALIGWFRQRDGAPKKTAVAKAA